MKQKRSKTGVSFEKEICQKLGLKRKSKSPKIAWVVPSNKGNIFEKMESIGYDPKKMTLDIEKSNFEKSDACNQQNEKHEIKKYKIDQCRSWTLYSEPFPCIKSREKLSRIKDFFGSMEEAVNRFNIFNEELSIRYQDTILNNIIKHCIGIQFIDGFVSRDYIDFRITIKKSWEKFNRTTIEFRVKENATIISNNFIDPTTREMKGTEQKSVAKLSPHDLSNSVKFISDIKEIILNYKGDDVEKILTELKLIYKADKLPERVKLEKRAIPILVNGKEYFTHTKDSTKTKNMKISKAISLLK